MTKAWSDLNAEQHHAVIEMGLAAAAGGADWPHGPGNVTGVLYLFDGIGRRTQDEALFIEPPGVPPARHCFPVSTLMARTDFQASFKGGACQCPGLVFTCPT